MSQLSSQVQDPNWVSVSIAKFSHNTTPYGTKSFVWTHVNNRNDLDLVIRNARVVDDYGNYQERILMKVTGGAEVLETQDLGQLVTFCREFDSASGSEYPVDIVVKSPFMAMRYPKTINTVRRIQVKLRSDSDFKRTLSVMNDLGLHITYKGGSAPTVAPSPSPTPSLALSASAFGGTAHLLADSLPRPTSSFTMSSSTLRSSSPVKPELTSSPVKSDFKIPLRSDTAFSDQGQANRMPYSTPHMTNTFSTSSVGSKIPPFSPQPRVESFNQLPAHETHSLFVSQMERESQHRRMPQPILPPPSSDNTNTRLAPSFYISQLQSQQDEALERVTATSRLLSASPFFSSAGDKEVSDAEKSQTFDSQRPSSTPIEHSNLMKMWIPPKRELPFPKPRKSSNSKSSSTPDLPPVLPKPTSETTADSLPKVQVVQADVASTPVKKPAPKKRVAQRKATNTRSTDQQVRNEEAPANEIIEESIPKLASIQEEPDQVSPLAAKSAAASFRPASAPGLISKAILPPKKRAAPPPRPASIAKRPKMADAATQTQALSGCDHFAAQSTAPNSTPNFVADTPSPASPPECYLNDLDVFINKHNPQPKPKELWKTPRYTGADEAHRQMMLNDFICENLENPDFLQLCQDAEFAWRRIGLGM